MEGMFEVLAIILGFAAVGGMAARFLKQPVILGYIFAGIGLSMLGLKHFAGTEEALELMSRLGVTLLLFLVGLELPIAELKKMGKVALMTGVGQVVITSIVGFGIARLLGFGVTAATYLGIALTFSSTIITVKLLSEKGDLQSLYGKITVGSLLVQDFVAIGILIVLAGINSGNVELGTLIGLVVKGAILLLVVLVLSSTVMPKILDWIGRSTEVLFIASIGWCMAVAAIVSSPWVGFSVEIGGILAGLAFANAMVHMQIVSRIKPLRDFFLTLFFVTLGAGLRLENIGGAILPAVALSLYVLIGNPLIMMTVLGWLGYKKRIAFLAGLTMAQISEFSLVLVALAVQVGQVGESVLTLVTLVGIITMVVCSYLITYNNKIYRKIGKYVPFWERKVKRTEVEENSKKEASVILFGHNRIGSVLRPALEKLGKKVLVVDFNPEIVDRLKKEGVDVVYGDMSDSELYDDIGAGDTEMIVSTIPDRQDSLQLLSEVRRYKNRPTVVTTANDVFDAKKLYKEGADYVLVPHSVGGELLAHVFQHHGLEKEFIQKYGKDHREKLAKL